MVYVNRRGYTHHSNVQILSALNNNKESEKQILIILLSCLIETLGLFMRDPYYNSVPSPIAIYRIDNDKKSTYSNYLLS